MMYVPELLILLALYLAYRVGRWEERIKTEDEYPQVAHDRAQARADERNRKYEEKRRAARRQS
jgi:hypothetical protein